MNVNEFMKQMRQAKKDGAITGEEEIVFAYDGSSYTDENYKVQSVNNWFKKTARLDDPQGGPKGTRYGNLVDGRGNPNGTEKVVRLV